MVASSKAVLPQVVVEGSPYAMGYTTGETFRHVISARVAGDRTLQESLLPFCMGTDAGKTLLEALSVTNRNAYPHYWEELRGTADGSGVPFEQLLVLNLRKEIAPFLQRIEACHLAMMPDQCSDVMLCCRPPGPALLGHNEDADGAVLGHTYLVRAKLESGLSFCAYTYAGELPSCAFGFNDRGVVFTLNAVSPAAEEVTWGGVGRNFVSRHLLEASDMEDALHRVKVSSLAVGHNYNLMHVASRRIVTVETAAKGQFSVLEIKEDPYFHANMYIRLTMRQKTNESSIQRMKRAAEISPPDSEDSILKVLGDRVVSDYPIYMTGNVYEQNGPCLYTLCTVIFDLDRRFVTIYGGNPVEKRQLLRLPLCG